MQKGKYFHNKCIQNLQVVEGITTRHLFFIYFEQHARIITFVISMREPLLVFLYLFLSLAAYSQSGITCSIKAKKLSIPVGKTPEVELLLHNNTDSTVVLINSLDGSSYKWRYPYAYYTIELMGDTSYRSHLHGRCGNMDGISSRDFFELKAHSSINPDKIPDYYFSDFLLKDPENFKKPGKYRIVFHYSTKEKNIGSYGGDGRYDVLLAQIELEQYEIELKKHPKSAGSPPVISEDRMKVLKLFKRIPHIEVTSNEIIIEIK